MKLKIRTAVFVVLGMLYPALGPLPAKADFIPPSAVVVRTKAYQPQSTNFPRGTYQYSVSWEGIPVGSASVKVASTYRDGKKMLDVEASARTGSVIRLFYALQHISKSIFSAEQLRPIEFHSKQVENSKLQMVDISFQPDGNIKATNFKKKGSKEPTTEEIDFKSENATFDPISAAFLARSLPVDPQEELSFDVFNGKHRYLIGFRVLGRETIRVAGKDYDAFKVEPSVKKLTDTDGEKRLRKAYIWVSTDPSREVLKLESEVFLGSVNAKMVSFVPDNSPEPETVRARLNESSTEPAAAPSPASSPTQVEGTR